MTPTATVLHGHCLEVLPTLADNSIDAVVTDPPYELTNGKSGGGFMGHKWDATGIAFDVRVWEEVLRVLKPGGYVLAFGGTRTFHRVAVAVEDAGFEIRDSLAWIHGQGFPKGTSQMKPAFEPIIMARKPFKGSAKANVLQYGTGALNIGTCRIEGESTVRQNRAEMGYHGGNLDTEYTTGSDAGRWPANVILDEPMAAVLDEQSGVLTGKIGMRQDASDRNEIFGARKRTELSNARSGTVDRGGASRFFYCAKAPTKERPSYVNDAGEKITHSTVKPLTLTRWLCRLITPPGGTILDLFAGSGTTLEAATLEGFPSIGIERDAANLPLIAQRLGRVS